MNITQFLAAADYSDAWLKYGLASGEFFVQQAKLFSSDYGSERPRGGTEHWRHGGFLYWLRQDLDEEQVGHLLEAAIADQDPPMAGNVLKALVGRHAATRGHLEAAIGAVTGKPDYYVSAEELKQLFLASHSGRSAA